MSLIPTIDLSPFLESTSASTSTKTDTAEALCKACEDPGVFYLTISTDPTRIPTQSHQALSAVQRLFSLSLEHDVDVCVNAERPNRGYIKLGSESGGKYYEKKEGFSYGRRRKKDGVVRNVLEMRNVWPREEVFCGDDRRCLEEYFEEMCRIGRALRRGFSMALGESEDYLEDVCGKGDEISLMRCFHYLEKNDEEGGVDVMGSSPHTDWGLCTLITQSVDGGCALEVYCEGVGYVGAEPREGCLVANCGDYLSLLTRGRFKSPLHRVVLTERERFSFVFFAYPNFEAQMLKKQHVPEKLAHGNGKLSILSDQREHWHSKEEDVAEEGETFGRWLCQKWQQVSRTKA